jgi:hypothetical protein
MGLTCWIRHDKQGNSLHRVIHSFVGFGSSFLVISRSLEGIS